MIACMVCGVAGQELCAHHVHVPPRDTWADSNRAVCDFIHRRKLRKMKLVKTTDWYGGEDSYWA